MTHVHTSQTLHTTPAQDHVNVHEEDVETPIVDGVGAGSKDAAAECGSSASAIAQGLSAAILQTAGTDQDDCELLLGRTAVLLSGGSLSMDGFFGEAAFEAGHGVVHWLAPGARPAKRAKDLDGGRSVCQLDPDLLADPRVTAALDCCARLRAGAQDFEALCHRQPSYRDRELALRRSFFQAARASAVYVVAHRLAKPDDAGCPPLDLGGDAGWAAQMYVNRFKPVGGEDMQHCQLFLFENVDKTDTRHRFDPSTAFRWSYWQLPTGRNGQIEGKFIPFGSPLPPLQRSTTTAWKAEQGPPAPEGFYAAFSPEQVPYSCTRHAEALSAVYAPRPEGERPKKGKGKGKGKGKRRVGEGNGFPEEADV